MATENSLAKARGAIPEEAVQTSSLTLWRSAVTTLDKVLDVLA